MKFSLIQVHNEFDGFVDGVWIQDHTGSIETARKTADETEKINGNKIKVVVVARIEGSTPNYNILKKIKRLG